MISKFLACVLMTLWTEMNDTGLRGADHSWI